MFEIKKMRTDHVIDFAAEELKKYLRMMMPECGEIDIIYEPQAKDGFRLGLAEDFNLIFEDVIDCALDDAVYIDTNEEGGILAGSNTRSVLFAVYRYLKENGCRFLYPGIDGEYIPCHEIVPITYYHKADYRFRGQCNEGTESQQCMLETIDFYTKLEMNSYMLEFDVPFVYYDRYYRHEYNEKNRKPEPITRETALQWKRQCETEISKRGLLFHDMGHGWTAEPFGLDSKNQWKPSDQVITDEIKQYLALVDGKQELYGGVALNTNLCMSNPNTRRIMVKSIVQYAKKHKNVSYIHVWLADGSHNHCECEKCKKMRPADYYMMIMNELDQALTEKGLSTRIVFIAYLDTLYAPREIMIHNPDRFALLYAPIQRSYTGSIQREQIQEPPEYNRNHWKIPISSEENAAFLLDWQKKWKGSCFCYEYHYWEHFYRDPGMMYISRRIYEDIMSLESVGLSGIIEDGSQRAFFPNGFAMYIFAEALRDKNCNYEKVKEDYFLHAYGESWKAVVDYLEQISGLFDFAYMEGECSADKNIGLHYNPRMAEQIKQVKEIVLKGREIATKNASLPIRVQTVSMRLLLRHTEYCEMLSEIMIEAACGEHKKAYELWESFRHKFGQYEYEIERYYDQGIGMRALKDCIDKQD